MAGLIPTQSLAEVQALNQLSERIFDSARLLMLKQALADDEALTGAMPAYLPEWGQRPMLPVMRNLFRTLQKKYGEPGVSDAEQLTKLDASIAQVRAQLDGKPYLLDRGFSYADISVIAALAMVNPPLAAGETPTAYQRANTRDEIVERYPDVFDWRDGVVARHRHRSYLGNTV